MGMAILWWGAARLYTGKGKKRNSGDAVVGPGEWEMRVVGEREGVVCGTFFLPHEMRREAPRRRR